MLDDLLELAGDLLELGGELSGSRKKRKKRPSAAGDAKARRPEKTTARRNKRAGEEPWEWKEEKPPWEF